MPEDRAVPGSAEDWLARAEGDLVIAQVPLPEGAFYEDLCFHAQQAAEKALKAVYQHYNKRFRYTPDLDELITEPESEPRCCITEPGQEYFQNLAIADFSEIRGHRGCHFG